MVRLKRDFEEHGEESMSPYELQRLERIRRNEEHLERMGFGDARRELMLQINKTTKRKVTKKGNGQVSRMKSIRTSPRLVQPRRSKRVKTAPKSKSGTDLDDDTSKPLVMLSYYRGGKGKADDNKVKVVTQDDYHGDDRDSEDNDGNDEDNVTNIVSKMGTKATRRHATKRIHEGSTLTDEEREILTRHLGDDYLPKFKEFLVYHDKISDYNIRSVMRQVTKLALGEGIRYESPRYGWPKGCVFMKGIKVTPASDIVSIMEDAQDAEDQWGRDHGNGWLLSHPLKKLLLFQQFSLNNLQFLASKCRKEVRHDGSDLS